MIREKSSTLDVVLCLVDTCREVPDCCDRGGGIKGTRLLKGKQKCRRTYAGGRIFEIKSLKGQDGVIFKRVITTFGVS